jgi:hypothetical protein
MAIVVHTDRRGTTMQMFHEGVRLMNERGDARPEMLVLMAYGDPDDIEQIAIWENREAFDEFLRDGLPQAAEGSGIDISNLDIQEVHDIVWAPQLVKH